MFVDRVNVTFKAGDGGDGLASFRREKMRPRGGPDGGDGGDGGDVILVASRNENTLSNFRYKKLLQAQPGAAGMRQKKHGKRGQDLEVSVPIGTVVLNQDGILADLVSDAQKFKVAQGGGGGYGNAHFTSSTRQAPRVAEKGEPGERVEARLELKMIADVGIIGLPNAGKSTLLSVISNAKPEIANYPFTTLHPNLGVVDIDKKHSLLFADIPGLIEGASQGRGLGDEFLRHVERTGVLVHLIDAYNEDIHTAYRTIIDELKAYRIDLSDRPQVIVLTKIEGFDGPRLKEMIKSLEKMAPKGTPVVAISSSSGAGVQELLRLVRKRFNDTKIKTRKRLLKNLPIIRLKESNDDWRIEKLDEGFIVTGTKIERFAVRTRFGDHHAEQRLRDILLKKGIIQQAEKQGIEVGQIIIIGEPEIGRLTY